MKLKRISTGIKGLDRMVQGGFPEGDVVLYSGAAGTGKTVACIQFAVEGLRSGEDVIYVASEETRGKLIEHAQILGFDFEKGVKDKKLEIFQVEDVAFHDPLGRRCKLPREPERRLERLVSSIKEWMTKRKGKRLIIDSMMVYALPGDVPESKLLNSEFFRDIDELGMTTIIVSELSADDRVYSSDKTTEILADGIVLFRHEQGKKSQRTLQVVKMRDTKIDDKVKKFTISKGGIKLIK